MGGSTPLLVCLRHPLYTFVLPSVLVAQASNGPHISLCQVFLSYPVNSSHLPSACMKLVGSYGTCRFVQVGAQLCTPLCITVDFDSLEDGAVKIRDRDTTEQVRVPIADLENQVRIRLGF